MLALICFCYPYANNNKQLCLTYILKWLYLTEREHWNRWMNKIRKRTKCLHNNEVWLFWATSFRENIKRDKLSFGETFTDNTNNQPTKQPNKQAGFQHILLLLWHYVLIRMETQSNVKRSKDKSWFVSAVISSSLHNDLHTHSATTPSVYLEILGGNFPLSFLRRWCKSDPHWPGILKAWLSLAGYDRYDRTILALGPWVCVLLTELSDLFPEKLPIPGRFN